MKKLIYFITFITMSSSLWSNNWIKIPLGEDSNSRIRSIITFNENEALVVGYDTTIYKTHTGGKTWEKLDISSFYPKDTSYGFDIYDASSYGDIAMLAVGKEGKTSDGIIFKSTDKGENWSIIKGSSIQTDSNYTKNPACDGAHHYHFYDVNMTNSSTAFTYLSWIDSTQTRRYGVFKTNDGGTTWKVCATPEITKNGCYIENVNNTIFLAGSASSYFFVSTDHGDTWTDYTNDERYEFIWSINAISDEAVFILGSKKLFLFENGNYTTPTSTIDLAKTSSQGLLALNKDSLITYYKHQDIWSTSNASENNNTVWTLAGDTSNYATEYTRQTGALYNDSIYALGIGCMYKIALTDVYNNSQSGLLTQANPSSVSIYTSKSTLHITALHTLHSVDIYNIKGQKVHHYTPNTTKLNIDTQELKPGIYIVIANNTTAQVLIK